LKGFFFLAKKPLGKEKAPNVQLINFLLMKKEAGRE